MNIIITGGLGFLGSNLADMLLKQQHKVILIDDLSTGRYENLTWLYRNHPLATSRKNVLFIQQDITSTDFVQFIKFQELGRIDQVYHLACPASPTKYYLNPLKTLDVNYIGTKNVLELTKEFEAKFLFSSTSEIYGNPLEHPQKETYYGNVDPTSPRSVYDEGKRVAETLVSEYHRTYKIRTKIARISNTFGPRMDPNDGRVVTNFIMQILKGSAVTIYGKGNQTRSFCYVDDLIKGLMNLMNSVKYVNSPVNIGNPHEITIKELYLTLSRLIPKKSFTEYFPIPVSDPVRRQLDISKIKKIGWHPRIPLEDGLIETIKYMKEEL